MGWLLAGLLVLVVVVAVALCCHFFDRVLRRLQWT
jgi:hypothetical protein